MTHVYDLAHWSKDAAFWPAENDDYRNSERQILTARCGELLAHLARWARQEGNQCPLWQRLIVLQRRRIMYLLNAEPQLRLLLTDPDCLRDAWLEALLKAIGESNCFDLPDNCPWTLAQVLSEDFYP